MLLITGAIVGWRVVIGSRSELVELDNGETVRSSEPAPKELSTRAIIFGKVFWGGSINTLSQSSPYKFSYAFSALNTLTPAEYDTWLASLDCNISDSAEECPPGYLNEASKWFDMFSIGGEAGVPPSADALIKTRDALAGAGIQFVGNFDPLVDQDVCEVVDLPARYRLSDGSFKEARMPIGICSINYTSAPQNDLVLDEIRKMSTLLPTWVYGYSGPEYSSIPSPTEQVLYRSFIDAGADIVIGSSSQWVQPAEVYKKGLIMYSLGNFIHDNIASNTNGGEEVLRGAGLAVTLTVPMDQSVLLWSRLSNECKQFKDDCRSKASFQGLVRPTYEYLYSIVAVDSSNQGVVKRADQTTTSAVLNRLNWQSAQTTLGSSNSTGF
jgi:hypothetical protein